MALLINYINNVFNHINEICNMTSVISVVILNQNIFIIENCQIIVTYKIQLGGI